MYVYVYIYTYVDVCVHHHINRNCPPGIAYDSSCGGGSGWTFSFESLQTWNPVVGPRRWHTLLYTSISVMQLWVGVAWVSICCHACQHLVFSCAKQCVDWYLLFLDWGQSPHDLILHMVHSMPQPFRLALPQTFSLQHVSHWCERLPSPSS